MDNCIKIVNGKDCCGCGACLNICPKDAITMAEDDAGFIFPKVDKALCVDCGLCKNVCVFSKKGEGENDNPQVYAAVVNDRETLENSSSGGVFSALANAVIEKDGVVFGASLKDGFSVEHIFIDNKNDLKKLRGSKYVQSLTGTAFRKVKDFLKKGKYVLYCGTPCQISGLKAYLGENRENLFTVDIICHGVPSMKMLKDDISYVTKGKADDIKDIKFRDKSYGWGTKGSLVSETKKIKYNAGSSPYYFYFLKGEVYRESCYNCRFPSENRQGDITLGDYWGIRNEVIRKLGDINPDLGISCVLVNSEKGRNLLDSAKKYLTLTASDRKSVEKRNGQLVRASKPLPEHNELLEGYKKGGYSAFKNGYKKHTKDHIVRGIKNLIPSKIKRKINDFLTRS